MVFFGAEDEKRAVRAHAALENLDCVDHNEYMFEIRYKKEKHTARTKEEEAIMTVMELKKGSSRFFPSPKYIGVRTNFLTAARAKSDPTAAISQTDNFTSYPHAEKEEICSKSARKPRCRIQKTFTAGKFSFFLINLTRL